MKIIIEKSQEFQQKNRHTIQGKNYNSNMDVINLIEEEAKRRNLSPRTIKTYQSCVKKFLRYTQKDPKRITKNDVKIFITYLVRKESSSSTINVYINALQFLLREILSKRVMFQVKFAKKPVKIPTVLSQEETRRLFEAIENEKHRLMIELMYSGGLRVSELCSLKVQDIDFERKIINIRQGKGRKDRIVMLAKSLVPRIQAYIYTQKISEALFPGRKGNISSRSLHNIIKKAARVAGIKKNIHCHTLRHSFATHLIENGYDVASVQVLLGHSSPKTTMTYVHIASPKLINIKSPLDN